jgi:hypothetical protein
MKTEVVPAGSVYSESLTFGFPTKIVAGAIRFSRGSMDGTAERWDCGIMTAWKMVGTGIEVKRLV